MYIPFFYVAYVLIFYEILQYGQLLQDDWSIAENNYFNKNYLNNFINYLNGFIARPVGALYLSLISFFGYNFIYYFIINITFYFVFNIIIFKIFEHRYNSSIAFTIIALLLFPNLNSTNIFSPAAQSLGTISLFLWSVSFYLIYFGSIKKNFFYKQLSWFFFILSVLTYEISFILIIFNIFFYNNSLQKIVNLIVSFKFKNIFKLKEVKYFFIIFLIIFFYQFFLVKILPFESSNRYRVFNLEVFNLIIQYSYVPFILILDTLLFFKKSFYILSEKIFYNALLIMLFFLSLKKIQIKDLSNINKFKKLNLFLIIIVTYLLFLLFFIIATSLPFLEGYYNRAMGAYNFIFSLFIIFFIICLNISNYLKKLFLILFVLINANLFFLQIENNIFSSKLRNDLIDRIISKVPLAYLDKGYVFSIFPTVSSSKPLSQVTFSEESYDFNKALLFKSKRKLGGIRIYKNIECINRYSLKIKNNKIIYYNPSKSKKSQKLIKVEILLNPKSKYLFYDYFEDNLIALNFGNHDDLPFKKLINCN